MKNILIIGGTGYLGTILNKYNFKHNLYLLNSKHINTNDSISVEKILQYIKKYNIHIIIDFARNTKRQFITFLLLIKKIPISIKYIHISTYGIMYKNIFHNLTEYIYVKEKIEQTIRNVDLSIRLPLIIDDINMLKQNLKDIKSNVIYINNSNFFAKYIFDAIDNNMIGHIIMPSIKIQLKNLK